MEETTIAAGRSLYKILVTEDQPRSLKETARTLRRHKGFDVSEASDARSAISTARKERVDLGLMDIRLAKGKSGIEAARAIQRIHPCSSFIFLSAYLPEPAVRRQIEKSGLRIGGWIEKPFLARDVIPLIEKERKKREVISLVEDAKKRGFDSIAYLRAIADLDPSLPEAIVREIFEEFQNTAPSETLDSEKDEIKRLEAQIDGLYDQLWELIEGQVSASHKDVKIDSIRVQLRELQEQEVDIWRTRFQSEFEPDLDEGDRILADARALVEKYR